MEEYLKMLALATAIPMCPRPVQKKMLFELINTAGIKLNENELKAMEHQYKDKPDCISIQHIRSLFYYSDNMSDENLRKQIQTLKKTIEDMENGKIA